MPIFNWEQATADFFASLPRDGWIFTMMHFISYPGRIGWLIYLALLLFYFRHQLKETALPFLFALTAVGIGDLVSRRVIKAFVLRLRPHFVNQVCEGSHCWGFVSSHMTNITAFVTIFCLYDRKNLWWAIPAVFLVGFSRLYLLDHYPLDVLGGMLIGFLIGFVLWQIGKRLKASKNGQTKSTVIRSGALIFVCSFGLVAVPSPARADDALLTELKNAFQLTTLRDDFISPIRPEARLVLGLGAGVTAADAIFRHDIDEPVNDYFGSRMPLGNDGLGSKIGELIPNLAYTAGMAAAYEFTKDKKFARRAALMFRATMHSGLPRAGCCDGRTCEQCSRTYLGL